MITKQTLEKEFPSFDIKDVIFKNHVMFMLIKDALHVYITTYPDSLSSIGCYIEGEKVLEEKEVRDPIAETRKIIKEYAGSIK